MSGVKEEVRAERKIRGWGRVRVWQKGQRLSERSGFGGKVGDWGKVRC